MSPFRWKAAPRVDSSGKVLDPDAIKILEGWADINITTFPCESLSVFTNGMYRMVTLNHQAKDDFLELMAAWHDRGLLEEIREHAVSKKKTFRMDGYWVPRYKRGLTQAQHDQNPNHLSNHASGHAFDMLAALYPRGLTIQSSDPIHQLVAVAEEFEWEWGGYFHTPDGMHFQHRKSPFA